MTAPLTLDDVLAWLALRTAYDVPPDMIDCLPTADPQHFIEYAGKGNVLLLGPHAGTALETGDIRTVLETAKALGLLPAPEPKQKRTDNEQAPAAAQPKGDPFGAVTADMIMTWSHEALAGLLERHEEAGPLLALASVREKGCLAAPRWAVFVFGIETDGKDNPSARAFLVVDLLNVDDVPASAVLSGWMKYDGCLYLDDADDVECGAADGLPREPPLHRAHWCGPSHMTTYTRLLLAVWALAHETFSHTEYDKPDAFWLERLPS